MSENQVAVFDQKTLIQINLVLRTSAVSSRSLWEIRAPRTEDCRCPHLTFVANPNVEPSRARSPWPPPEAAVYLALFIFSSFPSLSLTTHGEERPI